MKKMKPILPSLKAKKRYIAFEVISAKPVARFSSVSKAVWKACLSSLGELGVSKAGIWLLPDVWNSNKQTGVIRASHNSVDNVRAALAFIKTIDRQKVIVRTIGVSGMLKKAKINYVQ